MCRWMSIFVFGVALVMGRHPLAAEEDPFGPPPPLPPETVEPEAKPRPITVIPAPPNPARSRVPTDAQKRIHERAAQERIARRARLQQRKQPAPTSAARPFPETGPLADPALFHIDRGVPIAFRPIALSGLDPLPNLRPVRSSPTRTPAVKSSPAKKPQQAPTTIDKNAAPAPPQDE